MSAVIALAAAIALGLAAPAGAAGWGEARELVNEIVPRVLGWLGLAPSAGISPKCDDTLHIDPNGCPKAAGTPLLGNPGGAAAKEVQPQAPFRGRF